MESGASNKDVQLRIVYGTAIAVAVYLLCTSVLPWLYRRVQLEIEKRSVISTLKKEVPSVDAVVSELRDYKSGKAVAGNFETKKTPRNPTYVLPRTESSGIAAAAVASQQKTVTTAAMTTASKRSAPPSFQLSSPQVSVSGARSRVTAPSHDPGQALPSGRASTTPGVIAARGNASTLGSPDLSTFSQNSIEARLHSSGHQVQLPAYTPEQLQQQNIVRAEERTLRERQDAEFRASEERDLQRLGEERRKQERTALVEARRRYLASAIKPEPNTTGGDPGDTVTLQFRFRDSASSAATQESAGSGKAARIMRRFSRTGATAEDLLLYVESLELRPLLSSEVELSLDFPTRVISRDRDCSRTLEGLGITSDSLVRILFRDG